MWGCAPCHAARAARIFAAVLFFPDSEPTAVSHDSPGSALRNAVADSTIQIPGAFNALVARLVEQTGYDAVYLSGAALSAGTLALPDVGLFTLSELAAHTAYIARSGQIPLIVDADTGFGEAINVERTVRELEAAGAAAIQLEDQRLPKRCGHLSGKSLVEPAEMCAKLRAAVAARRDPNLVLIARTDAAGVTSLDDAIYRAQSLSRGRRQLIGFSPERSATARRVRPLRRRDRRPARGEHDGVRQKPVVHAGRTGRSRLRGRALSGDDDAGRHESGGSCPGGAERRRNAVGAVGPDAKTRQELYDLLGYAGYEQRDQKYFGGETS